MPTLVAEAFKAVGPKPLRPLKPIFRASSVKENRVTALSAATNQGRPKMPTLAAEAIGPEHLRLKPIFSASGVKGKHVTVLSAESGIVNFIESVTTNKPDTDTPFCVLDLGVVMDLMDKWASKLPTVQPFYAVKCNPNLSLIGALAALGSSFDCASKAEIESVPSLGVSPERIIYANPSKSESHIKYAATVGVNVTAYDSNEEVEKICKLHPKCELILRIKPPKESGAGMSLKYGALPEEVPELLQVAHAAGLKVIGVSFDIGTGGDDMRAFEAAIAAAKSVFETTFLLGMPRMRILDIGGGFTSGSLFDAAAWEINVAIQAHLRDEEGLMVIGEPGRYFSETVFTLATRVIGKRVRGEVREYWINDGIYGTLSCLIYENIKLTCMPLACTSKPKNPTCRNSETYPSTVFGPTCDAIWACVSKHGGLYHLLWTNFNGFRSSAKSTYLACSSPIAREQIDHLLNKS